MISSSRKTAISLSSLSFLFACIAILWFVHSASQLVTEALGHDQTWYLFAAQRFLGGAKLYGPHLVETNPPFIIWFSVLPVLLSRAIHVAPPVALRLLVLIMIVGSIAWSIRVLRLNARQFSTVSLVLLSCSILVVEFPASNRLFGQREHMLVICALPYVLAAATGVMRRLAFAERCALGLTVGIALCFKPQQALVLVGLELFLVAYTRRLRTLVAPELLSAIFACGLYLVLARILTPRYFTEIVPLLLNTYWAFGSYTAKALMFRQRNEMLLLFAVSIACFVLHRYLHDRAVVIALLVCGVAASITFDLQHTGWGYQLYPSIAFLVLAAFYLVIDLLDPIITPLDAKSRLSAPVLFATLSLMAVFLATEFIRVRKLVALPSSPSQLDSLLGEVEPNANVYIFSTALPVFTTVYRHNLGWGSRFAHLWMLPAIVRNELGPTNHDAPFKTIRPETLAALADLQRMDTAEDLDYWKPAIVLVEHCTPEHPCEFIEARHFDILSWFLQSPKFAAVWSHYKRQPSVDDYDVYAFVP
jgi:hypothetical protein